MFNLNRLLASISPEQLTKSSLSSILIVIVALVSRLVAHQIVKYAIYKIEDDDPDNVNALEQRAYTLGSLARNIFNVIIYGTMIVMLLDAWGVNIAPILTGAGIVGLAVGFGTQSLVKDTVTGFFILFENQFNVEDRVKIANQEGKVISMGIRTTTMLADDGTTYIIPNSHITTIARIPKKE